LNVGLVLFESADARDAEKIFEFIQETLLIAAGKIDGGRGHGESFLYSAIWISADGARERIKILRKRNSIAPRGSFTTAVGPDLV
jgi:hypothetical protein